MEKDPELWDNLLLTSTVSDWHLSDYCDFRLRAPWHVPGRRTVVTDLANEFLNCNISGLIVRGTQGF